MGRLVQEKKDLSRAREQFNDNVADAFAQLQKDQKVFYVGSVDGNAAFGGRRITSQCATIAQAITNCTASRGDTILVSPFHTETVTTPISMSKAGTILKGLKIGNQRPVISVNGAVDLLSMDAAGCEASGLQFAIVTTDAATSFVNLTAAFCKISDLHAADCSAGSSVNVVDTITIASGANSCLIDNIRFRNTTTAVVSFVSIEAAVSNLTIQNCFFFGDVTTSGIRDGAAATQLFIQNNRVAVVGTTKPAATFSNNSTGYCADNYFHGTDATLANNFLPGNKLRLSNNLVGKVTDGTKSALLQPVVDS